MSPPLDSHEELQKAARQKRVQTAGAFPAQQCQMINNAQAFIKKELDWQA
jgi:hypothetical protein